MPPPLLCYLHNEIPVARHDHIAILYSGPDAAFELAPFLAEGLRQGEMAVYLGPLQTQSGMLARLRQDGVRTDAHFDNDTLRMRGGFADYADLRAWTQRVFHDAEDRGLAAVRWVEEGLWPHSSGFPLPEFYEFHALLNLQVKLYPSAILCQYNFEQVEVHALFSALSLHRHLIVNGKLIRNNPFYIPAEKFLTLAAEERERDLMAVYKEVNFNLPKLLEALLGYGSLEHTSGEAY
jgi:MEDS: MEthanogen/methylotroph, DcmR Sensory domain